MKLILYIYHSSYSFQFPTANVQTDPFFFSHHNLEGKVLDWQFCLIFIRADVVKYVVAWHIWQEIVLTKAPEVLGLAKYVSIPIVLWFNGEIYCGIFFIYVEEYL